MIVQKKSLMMILLASFLVGSLSGCLDLGVLPVDARDDSSAEIGILEGVPDQGGNDSLLIEVGIEPTPVPTSFPYQNTAYGYEISYPETWQLSELERGIELSKGNARLVIQVWWNSEANPPLRWYGMPAGDLLYRDKLSFLGEVLPVQHLVYQEKVKQVLYNDGAVVSAGDLQVLLYLWSEGTEYENIELEESTLREAKIILESFQVSGLAAPPEMPNPVLCATDRQDPPEDWQLYENQRYGFFLYYPGSLVIYETGEHNLEFQRENGLILRLEFRRIDQQYALPGLIPEGEVELTRFVSYFGDENPNPIVVERSSGVITRVSVGNVFGRTTPVQFHAVVAGPTGMEIDLDQVDSLLEILDTICLTS